MVKQAEIMLKVGSWSFLVGILIAGLVGLYQAWTLETFEVGQDFFSTSNGGLVAWFLAAVGIIVGGLAWLGKGTITKKEIPGFLMAGIALVVMYGVFKDIVMNPWLGSLLHGISMSLAIFVAPAVGILAIKAIWDIGKDV